MTKYVRKFQVGDKVCIPTKNSAVIGDFERFKREIATYEKDYDHLIVGEEFFEEDGDIEVLRADGLLICEDLFNQSDLTPYKPETSLMYKIFTPYKNLDLKSPDFESAGKVHDWRNYVPQDLKDFWSELTDRERKIIHILCEKRADAEYWD